mmetsp:Transcript_71638/g.133923  ORF Transcript_71638/g.133923 Transcript_71638/m.133923 type:complete len:311 (-) Transcript_71638:164-1096(-)
MAATIEWVPVWVPIVRNTFIEIIEPGTSPSERALSQTLPARLPLEKAPAKEGSISSEATSYASARSEMVEEDAWAVCPDLGASCCTLDDSQRFGCPDAAMAGHGMPWHLRGEFYDGADVAVHEESFAPLARPVVEEACVDHSEGKAVAAARDGKLKLWCHFYLHEDMLQEGFHMAKKIIGKGGEHTKSINEQTDAKVRLRGKGSGHVERDSGAEAQVPLMLAVTSTGNSSIKFVQAVEMAIELLDSVESKYQQFLKRQSHRGCRRCFWIGALSARAKELLDANHRVHDLQVVPSQDARRLASQRGRHEQR